MRGLFTAHTVDEQKMEAAMRGLYEETGFIADPHTAVALAAARWEQESDTTQPPMVVLSTAHAAKFPDVAMRATGRMPEEPERLRLRFGQKERCAVLPKDVGAVTEFILAHAAGGDGVPAVSARAEAGA